MNPLEPIATALKFIYGLFIDPIAWALEHLTLAFESVGPLRLVGSFGVAIIVVTLGIRALLFPVFQWQLKTQRRIQAEQRLLAPAMKEVRKKHRGDPQTLNAEIMALYKEHGVSPLSQLSGCLPVLLQIPILGGLYNGVRNASSRVDAHSFLWVSDLSRSAKDIAEGSIAGTVLHPQTLIIPLAAAAATFVQSKIMQQPARPDMSEQEMMAYSTAKNMAFLAPVMVLVMGVLFPQGIAIYWVTQSCFMVLQEYYLLGWGGLKVPAWFPGANRSTPLSFSQQANVVTKALGHEYRTASSGARPGKVRSGGRQVAAPVARKTGSGAQAGSRPAPGTGGSAPGPKRGGGGPRPRPARSNTSSAGGGRRKRGR